MSDIRPQRRPDRRGAIQEAACRLVADRGFDGFTMDDLAAAVGVSRRTLFNHVPDKQTAVLGDDLDDDYVEAALARFAAADPTARLDDAIQALVREIIVHAAPQRALDCHLAVERAIAADPKVARIAFGHLESRLNGLVDAVCARQGWIRGDLRARVAAVRAASVLPVVFDEVRRRGGTGSFLDVYDDVVAAARSV